MSDFILIPKKGNAKECPKYWTIALILARLFSKSLKLGFRRMWTEKSQLYKLGLEKAEEPEIKLPTFLRSYRKQTNSRKTSALLTTLKPLSVWITKYWIPGPPYLSPKNPCRRIDIEIIVKKQQLKPDIDRRAEKGKEYKTSLYCHLFI